ncbi:MAG: nickel pincer cofactor biosynthesis protein LarC [Lachnospiraceae bacterium]|nr:nickel pincer cofactor biosynthesis protein LarC [Lachnospiraceae bacterium]
MRTLYLDCSMGAAGDMLTAALLELHPEPETFVERLNHIGLQGVAFRTEKTEKCGIVGTHMVVTVNGIEESDALQYHEHDHEHHGLNALEHIISQLRIPQKVRENMAGVYHSIADAESHVHAVPVEEIHFHEVGALDAVADIAAVCLLLHELAPERIEASPIHVGSGQVRCAHGILPVPAPATALILRGIPTYGSNVQGELCTPTGAALLKYFVQQFGVQPPMRVEKIGYGCGKKDFEQANCVRALLGETSRSRENIIELCCNLDDMTPEAIGFAMETLLAAGALDVYTIPAGMKKNRPGILFTCMCRSEQREEMLRLMFLHTTTLGIRESVCNRYTLKRSIKKVETDYGPVRVKEAEGWGVRREKTEYEDLARFAKEKGISILQLEKLVNDV